MKNTTSRRIAAAAAISGVTAVALATMGAGAAAAGPLAGGKTTQVLDDGTSVTVVRCPGSGCPPVDAEQEVPAGGGGR